MASSARPVRSQYQHYIPRFVLRNFKETDPNRTKEAEKFYDTPRRGDELIRFYDIDKGSLGFRPLSIAYGATDMYRDAKLEDTMYIEKALSKLEGRAATVIRKLLKAQSDKQKTVTISSRQLHILRRFLFVMQYRTTVIRNRYQCAIDEYKGADKEDLREYMKKRNFQQPNDVWLETLRLILDAPESANSASYDVLESKMYGPDYKEFRHNLNDFFINICEPESAEDEFIITDTGFSVMEGLDIPEGGIPQQFSEMTRMLYTKRDRFISYHKIAVVSPRLAIVLRHVMWNDVRLKTIMAAILGPSTFDDLPVESTKSNFKVLFKVQGGPPITTPAEAAAQINYSLDDTYEFTIFPIPNKHIRELNTMQIDKAQEALTFSSRTSMQASLMHFIETGKKVPLSVLAKKEYAIPSRRLAAKIQLSVILDEENVSKNLPNVPRHSFSFARMAKLIREMVEGTNYLVLAQGSIDMFSWDLEQATELEKERARIASTVRTGSKSQAEKKMQEFTERCIQNVDTRIFLMSIRLVQSQAVTDGKKWLKPTPAETCVFKLWGNPKVSEIEFKRLMHEALWKENFRGLATKNLREMCPASLKPAFGHKIMQLELEVAKGYGTAIDWAIRTGRRIIFDMIRGELCNIGLCRPDPSDSEDVKEMNFRDFLRKLLFSTDSEIFGPACSYVCPDLLEEDSPWRELILVWLYPHVDQEWVDARWRRREPSLDDLTGLRKQMRGSDRPKPQKTARAGDAEVSRTADTDVEEAVDEDPDILRGVNGMVSVLGTISNRVLRESRERRAREEGGTEQAESSNAGSWLPEVKAEASKKAPVGTKRTAGKKKKGGKKRK
ncbi:hypothetical protein BJ508DRAFT_414675 [Ascobolus immersus RN42]|uniref:DUF4238 domain-containing protein n=1 Tax=Ascobolus immersus RN42 TaxID=1160509 RepID=A0A3N4I699_ASCIM|nr:hypothetical protein BJ508DRAFT_414675 [Ascobolus immersus RN42]